MPSLVCTLLQGTFIISVALPAILGVITFVFQKLNSAVLSCKHIMHLGEIRKLALSKKWRLNKGQTTIQ